MVKLFGRKKAKPEPAEARSLDRLRQQGGIKQEAGKVSSLSEQREAKRQSKRR